MLSPAEILSKDGPLAAYIDDFAVREQQQELAESIAQALEDRESLICEAGTGTGKTFAYLVPALISGKKIIISTGTKHLQDQLYYKDLPVVRKALGLPVITALLKGRTNYLCMLRLEQSEKYIGNISSKMQTQLIMIRKWALKSDIGDLTELADLSEESQLRTQITSTTENCLGQECQFYNDCFVFKARRRANEATLIVVNHHLLMSDLSLRETGFGQVLPKADAIIFDEAHQLPELAVEFFSQTLSSHQFIELINDSRIAYLSDAKDVQGFMDVLDKLQNALRKLRLAFGNRDYRIAWHEIIKEKNINVALNNICETLQTVENILSDMSQRSQSLQNCWRRCGSIMNLLDTFLEHQNGDYVQWLETRGQGFLLHQTPLEISGIFQTRLAEQVCNCIYTSATLAVGNDFTHFTSQLGLTDVKAQSWPSPFDYRSQALLYLPPGMPDPREPYYTDRVINAALPVIHASQGHAFLLFTSHRALQDAAQLITNRIDYPVFIQGEAPRTELLERFRKTRHAVLLGTSSFWEGVDVRGQALSCVIIDKLPFAPPDDPVFKARAAKMQQNGINPFIDYQLPEAVINLKQGAGRLIRDMNDYGVIMICDPRIMEKSYGRVFLDSLPEMKISTNITDVEDFYTANQNN
ncbi:MAG: ATP-dependent DNA helicase [Gammaproteobacteria bacterium]|nr:ATP-dependent DNA helicase [Gammaproteobacteria bacterium]